MKTPHLIMLSLVGAMSLVPLAQARPFVDSNTEYYKIRGKTEKQLNEYIARKGPKFKDGVRRPAKTDWTVETHYDHKKTNKGCHLTQVRVRLNIVHWSPKISSDSLFTVWITEAEKRFNRGVKKYQAEHQKIAHKAAREVESALKSLRAGDNCDEYEREADAMTNKIVKRYVKKRDAFDKKTKYGETLGVKF